jgi:hypothetical protein
MAAPMSTTGSPDDPTIGGAHRAALNEAGRRPVGVSATVVNPAVGLGLAVLLFSGFSAAT